MELHPILQFVCKYLMLSRIKMFFTLWKNDGPMDGPKPIHLLKLRGGVLTPGFGFINIFLSRMGSIICHKWASISGNCCDDFGSVSSRWLTNFIWGWTWNRFSGELNITTNVHQFILCNKTSNITQKTREIGSLIKWYWNRFKGLVYFQLQLFLKWN